MKTIHLKLPDDVHLAVKLKAFRSGQTIQDFVLTLLTVECGAITEEQAEAVVMNDLVLAAERVLEQQPPPPKPVPEAVLDDDGYGFSGDILTCKNGHPTVRGKLCIAKGCKFSVYA